jgi:hypothetical protein
MCELLGMSANVPTDICFSFTGLVQRGGGTGPHKDGWVYGWALNQAADDLNQRLQDLKERTRVTSLRRGDKDHKTQTRPKSTRRCPNRPFTSHPSQASIKQQKQNTNLTTLFRL